MLNGNTPLFNVNLGHLFAYPAMELAIEGGIQAAIQAEGEGL